MQGALHFVLPGQGVDKLMELDRGLEVGEGLAVIVYKLQVRDQTERVGHRDHALLQLDPVPCDAGGSLFAGLAPEGLAAAQAGVVAKTQHPSAEVGQMQLRRAAGLPQ